MSDTTPTLKKPFRSSNDETVVLLSHKKPDGHINVKVEFGEGEGKVPLDNIAKRAEEYKPKERVTYKMIKEYIEAKYGFKVHTAYIAEVKRDLGLPMYDAPNAVEELKQPRKHPTAEKVEAIKDALKYFEVFNEDRRIIRNSGTVLLNFPLYCPKCKQETLIEAKKLQVTVIEDIDKKRDDKER